MLTTAHHEDEKITYLKLKRHIEQNHPTKVVESKDESGNTIRIPKPYSLFEELGWQNIFNPDKTPVTRLAKDLGLGPTLFLMSAKSMSCLFILLTILSIP